MMEDIESDDTTRDRPVLRESINEASIATNEEDAKLV
jgi:hypothetical protein